MGHVLLGIFIGATVIYYFSNRIFRHGVNVLLLFFFRIPVKLLEFIDFHTCGTKPVHVEAITVEKTFVAPKQVEAEPIITPEPKQKIKQTAQSFRNPDGKQVFQMDDESLINEWLSKNPDLKVEH
jgi:hypothetical protein